jgi:hypothetical protein
MDFRNFSELDSEALVFTVGLVVCDEIWTLHGRPSGFEEFRPEYMWNPYKGQTEDL